MRKSWQSQETVLRQSLDGHEEVYYSTSVVIPYRHVCSCLFARCPHTDLRVATRPWLAFQAKGHGKNLVLINSVLINSVLIILVLINSVLINSVLRNSVLKNSVRINLVLISSVCINSVLINPVLINSVLINSVLKDSILINSGRCQLVSVRCQLVSAINFQQSIASNQFPAVIFQQ